MGKREFLMLAHTFDPIKHRGNGWYCSEKLDGVRCFYDGGITRGMNANDVPWANTAKHARFKTETICTGLYTRYGQPVMAPDFWLDDLPDMPLDGELTMGRKSWQRLSSCIKKRVADDTWLDVKYMVFGSPALEAIFEDGTINGTNYKKKFSGIMAWIAGIHWPDRVEGGISFHRSLTTCVPFYKELKMIRDTIGTERKFVEVLKQEQLPSDTPTTKARINSLLDQIEAEGGEGLILRAPTAFWRPERTYDLLKVKRLHDMEGTVVGYRWAKPTDLDKSLTGETTNKLLGLMGSVRLKLDSGVEFDLSGFTDDEREMTVAISQGEAWVQGESARAYGIINVGEVVPDWIENPRFPRGSRITFRYRELSDSGVPKEARYWRKHEEL